MMKYAVNHHGNFTNPYASFAFGFVQFGIAVVTEIMVMLILTSMPDTTEVVIKFVALARLVKVPEFYMNAVASMKEHKLICVDGLNLKVT